MSVSVREPRGDDHVTPFLIDGTHVRGRLVRMGGVVDDILSRHADLSEPAGRLLGEAAVLAALLGSGLKFDGKLIIQAKGDGDVAMLVADYAAGGGVRATATETGAAPAPSKAAGVAELMGKGHFAITIDQGADMRRYQGVTPLEGATLADCAVGYFERSEQIPTTIKVSVVREVRPGGERFWRAGGMMLQHLPGEGEGAGGVEDPKILNDKQEDDWTRAGMLMGTTEDAEMVDTSLSAHALLYRLFNEDGVRVFEDKPLARTCSCSRAKIAGVLARYDKAELAEMVDRGRIRATCEFCRTEYLFDPDEDFAHDAV